MDSRLKLYCFVGHSAQHIDNSDADFVRNDTLVKWLCVNWHSIEMTLLCNDFNNIIDKYYLLLEYLIGDRYCAPRFRNIL